MAQLHFDLKNYLPKYILSRQFGKAKMIYPQNALNLYEVAFKFSYFSRDYFTSKFDDEFCLSQKNSQNSYRYMKNQMQVHVNFDSILIYEYILLGKAAFWLHVNGVVLEFVDDRT